MKSREWGLWCPRCGKVIQIIGWRFGVETTIRVKCKQKFCCYGVDVVLDQLGGSNQLPLEFA